MAYYSLMFKIKATANDLVLILSRTLDIIVAASVVCKKIGCKCFAIVNDNQLKNLTKNCLNIEIWNQKNIFQKSDGASIILNHYADYKVENYFDMIKPVGYILDLGKGSLNRKNIIGKVKIRII